MDQWIVSNFNLELLKNDEIFIKIENDLICWKFNSLSANIEYFFNLINRSLNTREKLIESMNRFEL